MRMVKQVVEIGNGAAVYVPKEYSGREVVVIFPEEIEDIQKRVLNKLMDFMSNVIGVYVYGSYARGEENENSDIDILIVINEKDERINAVLEDMDARVMTLESIKQSIVKFPGLIMPILNEAKTILNPLLLGELKNSKINYKNFKWNFEDTKRAIKIVEDFIKLDEKNISASHIYSLIMRLRVLNMLEGLIKKRNFSNQKIFEMLKKNNFSDVEIERFFEIYRKIRNDEKVKGKIEKEEILKLICLLKGYLKEVENEAKKKA